MEQEIKNIVFDVGNVLIDFCWEKTCRMLGFSQEVIDAFGKNMVLTDMWDRLDEGTISQEDAIDNFVSSMPRYEKEIRLFWDNAITFVEEYDYAYGMIMALKEKGYKVYLLSNYPLEMYKLHWPTFRFFKEVDGFVVSAVERIRKPDVRIYECLCQRYGLVPEQCLFFDDRQDNVDAAKVAGMQAVLFKEYGTVADLLLRTSYV